ncbi:ATP-binding protein [Streptomyces rishiriensis]|uniref:Anti-sigma regulatory factor (Ser/Thr protein kinase) n=1 Tax=Streptomyces rishiriensis TaxID=68264 RepID=A0ABU0P0I2_STRRH|nr:ATP-binding protein [Streptomyces rishiriensis]MDQ0584896.1 anti-sigma regulatory factor (Ser/Thr protein kinase) [Streptomyces rishiriensis]
MSSPAQFRSYESVSVRDSPRTAALYLMGSREGFAQARDFTQRTLDCWSLERCTDDAVTVVTELAANAVLHGLPHTSTDEFPVRLRLTLRRAHLVCAVTDPSDRLPVHSRAAGDLLEHGRGLHIIEALSEHWGWTRRSPAGKTVWAMLPTRPRPDSDPISDS